MDFIAIVLVIGAVLFIAGNELAKMSAKKHVQKWEQEQALTDYMND